MDPVLGRVNEDRHLPSPDSETPGIVGAGRSASGGDLVAVAHGVMTLGGVGLAFGLWLGFGLGLPGGGDRGVTGVPLSSKTTSVTFWSGPCGTPAAVTSLSPAITSGEFVPAGSVADHTCEPSAVE
jgi:hypothetical protein